ncbi:MULTISPECIES: hypothetical protein [unclassified Microbacterium]|uniref:hypothetical protein n=1 Tax=unclassified Microbacterium TaxID=2609290 RepID=UPI00301871CB
MTAEATTKSTTTPTCTCGCGEQISPTATYRAGHDARHAGQVARAIAADPKQAKTLLLALPSPALRAKAQRAADRLAARATTEEAAA